MKITKIALNICLVLICLLVSFLVISVIRHQINLKNEKKLLIPLGKIVEVNGHNVHIYEEGEGKKTLIFMSGGGTASPTLDFKSLYVRLSDQYRIVVIEKPGYGYSEVTNTSRDINTLLSETRESLAQADIKGPYVLVPHSMSGIEALYWAQKYPEEVNTIIGLDMATPASYKNYPINLPMIKFASFAASLGIARWIPHLAESDAIKYGQLTDHEKAVYRAIFYNRTLTLNMVNEIQAIKANARLVAVNKVPDINYLLFSSNGQGTGWSEEKWRTLQKDFSQSTPKAKLIELDCSHYVHDIEYERIAKEIKGYLDGIK